MTTAVRDRAPEATLASEPTERKPVMLVTLDISFDELAVETAVAAAIEANSELLVCLAISLPVGNGNAAARRTMGNPVVREEITQLVTDARAAGARAKFLTYNSPRPLSATIGIAKTREVGLLVFGPDRKRYGRLRFRLHARTLRRKAGCLVWPLE